MSDFREVVTTKEALCSLTAKQLAVVRGISEGAKTVGELSHPSARTMQTLIKRGIVVETVNGYLRLTLAGLLVARTDADKRSKP